ncbi:MAG: PAS domain S-box protein [Deltaproteobacteria bacterium]|nr:PAS domain S-box protein [Deltaproteobacteria bacterium]
MNNESLQDSSRRIGAILDSMTEGLVGIDFDWRCTYANEAAARFLGKTKTDLIGQKGFELFPEARGTVFETNLRKALEERESVSFEAFYEPLKSWYECRCSPSPEGISVLFSDTTEKRRRDKEHEDLLSDLNRKAAELEAVIDTMSQGLKICDMAGNILTMNRAALDLHGFKTVPDARRPVSEYSDLFELKRLDGEPIPAEEWPLKRVMRGDSFSGLELRRYRKDTGMEQVCEFSGAPVRDATGRPVLAVVMLQDISERKREEQRIRRYNNVLQGINRICQKVIRAESEEAFGETCLEIALEITGGEIGFIAEIGNDGLLHYVAVSQSGWSQCAMIEQTGPEGPSCAFPLRGLHGRVVQDGKSLVVNDPRAHPDSIALPEGHPPLSSFLGVPLIEDGETTGIIAVANRKTGFRADQQEDLEALAPAVVQGLRRIRSERERALTEESLRSSESRYRELVQNARSAIIRFERNGTISFFNEYAQELFGYSEQEILGKHVGILLPEIESSGTDRSGLVREVVSRPERYMSNINENVCRDGRRLWMTWTNHAIYDETGRLAEILAVGSDITKLIQAEEDLRRSRDELERRVKERTAELRERAEQLTRLSSQLTLAEQRERRRLSVIIHDHVQQLLVGAKISLEVLADELGEEHQESVGQIYNLLLECLKTTRSLSIQMAPHVLYERGLAPGLSWLARTIQETFRIDIEADIGSGDIVEAEDLKVLLFESARELLLNVINHARTSSARLEMSRDKDGNLRIAVSDQGVGFDAEKLAKELGREDRFGLFSIRERLELIGGRLEIESSPGKGAVFGLVVPIEKITAAGKGFEARKASHKGAVTALTPAEKRIRVLLVDDHTVMRHGILSLLERYSDIEVVGEAGDGLEAVQMARNLQPEVILMDISMPKMNGLQATKLIHSESPHIRIIGLSMYDGSETEKGMLVSGAAACIPKSAHSAALLTAIRQRNPEMIH